jgi:hypothetical protein
MAGTLPLLKPTEGMDEAVFSEQPLSNSSQTFHQKWGRRRITRDDLRIAEIVEVMATGAAKGEHKRKGLSAATGATNPLLVVEALWRHVGLQHGFQRANVDAHLHGGGHRQHLDAMGLQKVTTVF